MTWLILCLLVYLQIGTVLLAWLLRGMSVKADVKDWVILILFWPLFIPFFRFLLYTQRMVRVLKDLDDRPE